MHFLRQNIFITFSGHKSGREVHSVNRKLYCFFSKVIVDNDFLSDSFSTAINDEVHSSRKQNALASTSIVLCTLSSALVHRVHVEYCLIGRKIDDKCLRAYTIFISMRSTCFACSSFALVIRFTSMLLPALVIAVSKGQFCLVILILFSGASVSIQNKWVQLMLRARVRHQRWDRDGKYK